MNFTVREATFIGRPALFPPAPVTHRLTDKQALAMAPEADRIEARVKGSTHIVSQLHERRVLAILNCARRTR